MSGDVYVIDNPHIVGAIICVSLALVFALLATVLSMAQKREKSPPEQ